MTTINHIDTDQIRSEMALFKAVQGDAFDCGLPDAAMASLEDCILKGFVFVNQNGQLMPFITMPLFVLAEEQYGIGKEINNQTFWKSFERVRDMDPREYVMHQIAHYFSTYGMEMMGLKARTYVPVQDLDIPNNILPFSRMTVIRLLSGSDIIELINHYAQVTTAPSQQRIEQFKPLMKYLTIKTDDIKSFELQVIKHDMDGTVPAAPQNFLRYLVYKTTGSTLLIKNRATRKAIQNAALNQANIALPYKPYKLLSKANPTDLATIFFRYRPIFLAFKKFDGCAPIINRIRRLADKYHVPMSDVSVQNFINLVLQKREGDVDKVIEKASNRELVKLANFLLCVYYSTDSEDSTPGVYNIRNGRTFVRKDVKAHKRDEKPLIWRAYTKVRNALQDRLVKTVRGKEFYIPSYISYAAPVSEKQFTGNIPWGTEISTFDANQAFTVGIAWMNQNGHRVDIDLHLNSTFHHLGWNGGYSDGVGIIYTGDQTDAPEPNGAAEAYYFKPSDESFILSANLYAGVPDMPYKMFMTSRKPLKSQLGDRWGWGSTYTFDPAEAMFAPIPLKFNGDARDMTIGLFEDGRFIFYGGSVNSGIVPSANYADFIKGLTSRLKTMIDLPNLLEACGAEIYDEDDLAELNEDERKQVISLAPEDLTATTLLDIIDGNL